MFNLPEGLRLQQWVPLPLRLVLGFGFLDHGWAKLSRGPAGFAQLLEQIGAPLPEVTAWVSTFGRASWRVGDPRRRVRRGW